MKTGSKSEKQAKHGSIRPIHVGGDRSEKYPEVETDFPECRNGGEDLPRDASEVRIAGVGLIFRKKGRILRKCLNPLEEQAL